MTSFKPTSSRTSSTSIPAWTTRGRAASDSARTYPVVVCGQSGALGSMPRQNRVTPFSSIVSTSARGTLTGNRGCLHDEQQHIRRHFQGTRWIICLLEFKGRRRNLMTPGITELFWMKPLRWRPGIGRARNVNANGSRSFATSGRKPILNWRAHLALPRRPWTWLSTRKEPRRTISATAHRLSICRMASLLPMTNTAYLVLTGRVLRWSPEGYEHPTAAIQYPARVVTPASVVRTLAAGYRAGIHDSAF